jgi:hypothetical protein
MMDVVDFAVKVTAAVLRRLADGIDTAEKPVPAPTVVNVHISATDIEDALKRNRGMKFGSRR